ncbi:DUF7147 family protein [Jeotgalibacillus soli]|uniref:DUF7147 domain-containing protein n=1 Tax=Jeotgalibacillus soli TaxID=889306 RepID=A0A0C2R3C7_9BACL|nr:methylthioribose kinase [Jeotgalibacillus soli]KIL44770.1 hypothetical protein KP78_23140 [Jeotgalibacillus soli]
MIQRFIELGEGYSDIYELLELIKQNQERLERVLALHTKKNDKHTTTLVVVMKPTDPGQFQALYTCREGIPDPRKVKNKRFDLFIQAAKEVDMAVIDLDVQHSSMFAEKELYYQYLIGILRMNRFIRPLA